MKSMTSQDIANMRLERQQITRPVFTEPEELVEWMGCLQAQDYTMAKWAIGCRLAGKVTDAGLEKAFNEGKFLRTHVLRPTLHFVAPKDIRWMLQLTAARIKAFTKAHHRRLDIGVADLDRSKKVFEKSLSAEGPQTRKELQAALAGAKMRTDEERMSFFLMNAELDGLIASAGKKGKQFAYGLLEVLVPKQSPLTREEALAELTRRYFTSHGPATMADLAWWSGLLLGDARKGIALNEGRLQSQRVNGQEYWWSASDAGGKVGSQVHLLPAFDEYFISYKDRSDLVKKDFIKTVMTSNGIFRPMVVVKGRITGLWGKEEKGRAGIKVTPFDPSMKIPDKGLATAIRRYEHFLEPRKK